MNPAVAARMIVGLLIQHAVWKARPQLFRLLAAKSDAEVEAEIGPSVEAA